MKILLLLIGSALVNNLVLSRLLGVCPLLGASGSPETAVGMGLAMTFMLTLAGMVAWLLQTLLLGPWHLAFLRPALFILAIACLARVADALLARLDLPGHPAWRLHLPLVTTNCAVLGLALLAADQSRSLWESATLGFGSGAGFALALAILAGLRDELRYADLPRAFRGGAVALLLAGLMSLSFLGFGGLAGR
ncbi:MAG TPA: electron transport complex subunit RsxA [Firmicutes bacterium]|nr:electron transport complex subunit RsxA [Bacillota bacterium]